MTSERKTENQSRVESAKVLKEDFRYLNFT